jgi:hypothetical protein
MKVKEFVELIGELVTDQWYLDLIYGEGQQDMVREIDLDLKYSKLKAQKAGEKSNDKSKRRSRKL